MTTVFHQRYAQTSPLIKRNTNRNALLEKSSAVFGYQDKICLGWKTRMNIDSGFDNPGTTCYINSTLQALFHVPAFVNWLTDGHNQNACTDTSCVVCMMFYTFVECQLKTGSSFEPEIIFDNLSLICKHLSMYRQEDAHEFLRYLLDSMGQCYLSALECAAESSDNRLKETTPINKIFGGCIRSEVTCGKCGHISTTFQHCQDLSLDIERANSIDEALKYYFEKERLDKSYKCERCKKHNVSAYKKCSIERAPNVLCVQLNRYSIGNDGLTRKNKKRIQIKEHLDVSDYVSVKHKSSARRLRYRLVSMVLHYGSSIDFGHYTAIGLTSGGLYYCFNDSDVKPVSLKKLANSSDSYIMFYELEPAKTPTSNSKPKLNRRHRKDGISGPSSDSLKSPEVEIRPKICNGGKNYVNRDIGGLKHSTFKNGVYNVNSDEQFVVKNKYHHRNAKENNGLNNISDYQFKNERLKNGNTGQYYPASITTGSRNPYKNRYFFSDKQRT